MSPPPARKLLPSHPLRTISHHRPTPTRLPPLAHSPLKRVGELLQRLRPSIVSISSCPSCFSAPLRQNRCRCSPSEPYSAAAAAHPRRATDSCSQSTRLIRRLKSRQNRDLVRLVACQNIRLDQSLTHMLNKRYSSPAPKGTWRYRLLNLRHPRLQTVLRKLNRLMLNVRERRLVQIANQMREEPQTLVQSPTPETTLSINCPHSAESSP